MTSRCNSNWFRSIELSFIPIHFCKTKNFRCKGPGCFLNSKCSNFYRSRCVVTWESCEEIHTSSSVKHVASIVHSDESASKWWIGGVPIQPKSCARYCQEIEYFDIKAIQSSMKTF